MNHIREAYKSMHLKDFGGLSTNHSISFPPINHLGVSAPNAAKVCLIIQNSCKRWQEHVGRRRGGEKQKQNKTTQKTITHLLVCQFVKDSAYAMSLPATLCFHIQQEPPLKAVLGPQHQECFPVGEKYIAMYQSWHKMTNNQTTKP